MRRAWMLWRAARDDLGLMWFAIRHADRPPWLLPSAALLALYALEPMNFAIPVLGLIDDLVLVPLVLHQLTKFIPLHIRAEFVTARGAVRPER